ncbi:S66 peptidase family protein [Granulicella arctica]|uniref:S66 peptidase family protein n=1 Tax=Granulicella arctica TaxID=940613 RepID=UPI0021E0F1DB|nr:LD-carboxypeptidase [Granulicella arctica]
MIEVVKAKALGVGSRLAVVSPASTPKPELVAAGMERLRWMGYEPVLFPHALDRGPLYYAGTLEDRLSDLHAAFADPAIDGIICARGGWGSAELLPYLDAGLIRASPKVFIGYSDLTSLQGWLRNEAGLVCFYGPMVAADFAKSDGEDVASWQSSLGSEAAWSVGAAEGLRVLRGGSAEGRLGGGCLSILVESLGTQYAPKSGDGVLFLEDIGTKPYQWDRMLCHLRLAGVLDGISGIVFGDMQQCVAPEEMELLEGALLHALREFEGPIAIGLRCGHVGRGNVTLPLGVRVRLECSDVQNPRMDFLEAAVNG